jgi:exonuclease III
MDTQVRSNNRDWTILCHNIRGTNSERKWNAIRNNIQSSGCDIVCLQETKRENFDLTYIRKFCPRTFDKFTFIPSQGNSGGTMVIWKEAKLEGVMVFENEFAQSVEFRSKLTGQKWTLTNIYAPCTSEGKLNFLA